MRLKAPELLDRLFELEHDCQVVSGVACSSQANLELPRVTVYRHSGGMSLIQRDGLPESIRTRLSSLDLDRAATDTAMVQALLATDAPCSTIFARVVYVFENAPGLVELHQPALVEGRWTALVDGQVASEAWSSAENRVAASVRVDTLPEFRGRGLAAVVTAAWVKQVLDSRRLAFYTHAAGNAASAALARKLGALEIADGVKYY
jgi:GNAT superfamily N-acetyltransferase